MSNNNPGCLGFLFQLFGGKAKITKEEVVISNFPYGIRDDFLSPSEFSFYNVLKQVLPDDFVICPKVSLKDIFYVTEKDRSKHTTYLNKISRKHVDFLICEKVLMKPVCGIELDDTSHARGDRVIRDEFVEQLYKNAGLKLLRFTNKRAYTLSEVEETLQSIIYLNLKTTNNRLNLGVSADEAPICPKCKAPFVLRTVKSGNNKGKQFYGCTNFPKCRETLEI